MVLREGGGDFDVTETLRDLQEEMLKAADNLEFEKAALLRDQIRELKRLSGEGGGEKTPAAPVNYQQRRGGRARRTTDRFAS